MLRKLHPNPTSERLIEITVNLIDENGGLQGVNLRKIAKLAGCAHTNVYNYFQNFEGLLWAALERVLERWLQYTEEREQTTPDLEPDTFLANVIASQIDFALEHSGWYRFIWLESLSGSPPPEVIEILQKMQINFINMLKTLSIDTPDHEYMERVSTIIHGYLHGEICKVINERASRREKYRSNIIVNTQTLLKLLTSA
jgi:AcrR family transcriptional regulator